MRLLLDQNLLPRLLTALANLYPGSTHVREIGFLLGHPPKVIWIRRGNCSTDKVAAILRDHHAEMLALERDAEGSFLALG